MNWDQDRIKFDSTSLLRELAILLGLTFAWALSFWTSNFHEISLLESRAFALHCFIVFSAQSLIYALFFLALNRRKVLRIAPLLILTTFLVANFYLVNLAQKQLIAGLKVEYTALLLLALFVVFFFILRLIRGKRQTYKLIYALIAAFIVLTVGTFFWSQDERRNQLAEVTEIPGHFTFPEFEQRPNVYIIFFDALIPEATARRFLKIEKLEYISTMRREGLHVLSNTFSDRVPTDLSINSFVAMDLSYFDNIPFKMRPLFDTGEVIGPLFENIQA